MSKKILFLTTAHQYYDERIFYHQALELKSQGFDVKVTSLCTEFQGVKERVEIESYSILDKSIDEKLNTLVKIGTSFQPHCIICSEPLTVVAAKKIQKFSDCSIIYDITEWYPSKRMLKPFSFPKRYFAAIKFFIFQLYAGWLSNRFIFGEKTKMFPLSYFYPFKKKLLLSYFPSEKYIHQKINVLKSNEITLCYTGVFSKEKGIENFLRAADTLQKKRSNLKIKLLLIGYCRNVDENNVFKQLLQEYSFENIEIKNTVAFEEFSKSFAEADICLDLREKSFENDRCLPIKVFYYSASGKPVIYTDLKATKKYVDVEQFGFLVNPENDNQIAQYILQYIDQPDLYQNHARKGRELYEKTYNWNLINQSFVDFVTKAIK